MKNASQTVVSVCVVLFLSSPSTPQVSSHLQSRTQRIQELLDLTGAGNLGVQVMHGILDPMKQALPQVPEDWWEAFMAKVNADDLNTLVVPIYEKNFTDHEIDAMLEFYRTPLGRSIISKLPTVMQESMAAGQVWGQNLAEDALRHLEADGYKLPAGLQS